MIISVSPLLGSSSNSKPIRSPAIVDLYSLPLPFPPGGLERHTLMIGGGGVQPLALGIDLRLVLSKQEEQVEENSALDRSWDRDECPSTLLRLGLPLPTARDLSACLSLAGGRKDRNSILVSYYGGEESRNNPEFSTTLDEYGERLLSELAEPSTIASRASVDFSRSPSRHAFLNHSVVSSPRTPSVRFLL
ncbi:hypothetical protein DL96DRAFT_1011345 [Flagelloscypha sp. PMI_526]|nr:hypothetical protein DL96DRAFT_1011345 [Flagelloscypha sp. PMI_526]